MQARIKKGVKPFSGRTFPIVYFEENSIVLDAGASGQVLQYKVRDPRGYRYSEVEVLLDGEDYRKVVEALRWVRRNLRQRYEDSYEPEAPEMEYYNKFLALIAKLEGE